jgi:Family of unknown function (DUF5317)
MLTTVTLAAIALGVGLLRRGSLDRLASTHFRFLWLLWIGFAIQIGAQIWSPDWLTDRWELSVLLVSNGLVAAFLVANFRLPGIALAGTGLLLNVLVIGLNGAMPVAEEASDSAGIGRSLDQAGLKHERLDADTLLPWLGDVLPIPILREVLSIGDILLASGIAYLIYARMTQHPGRHSLARQ